MLLLCIRSGYGNKSLEDGAVAFVEEWREKPNSNLMMMDDDVKDARPRSRACCSFSDVRRVRFMSVFVPCPWDSITNEPMTVLLALQESGKVPSIWGIETIDEFTDEIEFKGYSTNKSTLCER
jgi:hypothetical protein